MTELDEEESTAPTGEADEGPTRPRGAGPSVDWTVAHAAIHVCRRVGGPQGDLAVEHLRSLSKFDADDTDLEKLLDGLIAAAIARRPDITPSAPCRVYAFKRSAEGQQDREQLEGMLGAVNLRDFDGKAHAMAERYAGMPRAREGVLLAVAARADVSRRKGLPFVFYFKCDFEEASRFDEKSRLERVEDVILGKLKKVAVFPHFDGLRQDGSHIKIYQSNASDYFHELFHVVTPKTTPEIFQEALHRAVMNRHADRLDDYFVGPPPKSRELLGESRYVKGPDLLPADEVRYLTESSARTVREDHDKPLRVRITIDSDLKFDADVGALGQRFFVARHGNHRFLIVRGERFETSSPLTGLDFLKLDEVEKVVTRLAKEQE